MVKKFNKSDSEKLKEIYDKSLKVLKKVSFKNGAIFASPPSRRYPFVYPRDTVLIIRALIRLEEWKWIKNTLTYLINVQGETGEWAQRYTKQGKLASEKPPQIDCNGLVLWAFGKYFEKTKDKEFLEKAWPNIEKGMNFIYGHYSEKSKLVFSANSIHEWPPIESGYDIWVNVCCYAGAIEAQKIARALKKKKQEKEWKKLSNSLKKGISQTLIKNNRFLKLKNHKIIEDADVSGLAPYILEVIHWPEEILENTASFIRKELWIPRLGGISRYMKKHGTPGRNNGGYGPYSMYTGWMAQYYLDTGDFKKAKECIDWFIKYSIDGKIPEHVSTKKEFNQWVKEAKKLKRYSKSRRKEEAERVRRTEEFRKKGLAYWVIPLTWGHAEFIITYLKLKEKGLLTI